VLLLTLTSVIKHKKASFALGIAFILKLKQNKAFSVDGKFVAGEKLH
jgi:hypothetical protein